MCVRYLFNLLTKWRCKVECYYNVLLNRMLNSRIDIISTVM